MFYDGKLVDIDKPAQIRAGSHIDIIDNYQLIVILGRRETGFCLMPIMTPSCANIKTAQILISDTYNEDSSQAGVAFFGGSDVAELRRHASRKFSDGLLFALIPGLLTPDEYAAEKKLDVVSVPRQTIRQSRP